MVGAVLATWDGVTTYNYWDGAGYLCRVRWEVCDYNHWGLSWYEADAGYTGSW